MGRVRRRPTTLPPLMVRGGVEQSETEGIRKSAFDMANRNTGINPQKGRHLLCAFCPCEKRKQGETSRRRERKETGSQPYGAPQVGVLYKFFRRRSLNFFSEKISRNRDVRGGVERSETEGIRRLEADKEKFPGRGIFTPFCVRAGGGAKKIFQN